VTWLDIWHHAFTCVTWYMHICKMTRHMWRELFTCVCVCVCACVCVTWLIHTCDISAVSVAACLNAACACVTWLIHMCDMTLSYVWHGPFICDVTHSYVCHDSRTRVISHMLKWYLFCKRALEKRLYSAKEPYDFKETCVITAVAVAVALAACVNV